MNTNPKAFTIHSVKFGAATRPEAEAASEVAKLMLRSLGGQVDLYLAGMPELTVEPNFSLPSGQHIVLNINFRAMPPQDPARPKVLLVAKGSKEIHVAEDLAPPPPAMSTPKPGTSHVMIDLETLGRKAGCQVLSLGAVVMTPFGTGPRFFAAFTTAEQQEAGLTAEYETSKWWAEQSEEARAQFSDPIPVRTALGQFESWLNALGPIEERRVWGNGADFDITILGELFDRLWPGRERPWKFYHTRCYRMLKNLRRDIKLERVGTAHNAADDAQSQAEHAIRLLKDLNAWADV